MSQLVRQPRITLYAVIGMHRSGTSATAGALSCLGVDFGPAALLMPASSDNPKGYFEALPVVMIHDRLLRGLRGRWDDPQIRGDWQLTMQGHVAQASVLNWIEGLRPGSTYGVKDPRMCLFYPMWKKACEDLLVDLRVCCVIREFDAIARSLQRRDGFSMSHARDLAEIYGRGVMEWSQHPHAYTVHFEELVENPSIALNTIASRLTHFPDMLDWEAVRDFLDPELVHV